MYTLKEDKTVAVYYDSLETIDILTPKQKQILYLTYWPSGQRSISGSALAAKLLGTKANVPNRLLQRALFRLHAYAMASIGREVDAFVRAHLKAFPLFIEYFFKHNALPRQYRFKGRGKRWWLVCDDCGRTFYSRIKKLDAVCPTCGGIHIKTKTKEVQP